MNLERPHAPISKLTFKEAERGAIKYLKAEVELDWQVDPLDIVRKALLRQYYRGRTNSNLMGAQLR